MWKVVVFDFDGTLVNSSFPFFEVSKAIFDHFNLIPPFSSPEEYINQMTKYEDILHFYRDNKIPENVTMSELNELWDDFFKKRPDDYPYHFPLKKGAKKILRIIKETGLNTAIVSGSNKKFIEPNLKRLEIFDLIDFLVDSSFGMEGKMEGLRKVAKHFSVGIKEMIYIDDMSHGIHAANKIGATAISVKGFQDERFLIESGPSVFVSSLLELLPLFRPSS